MLDGLFSDGCGSWPYIHLDSEPSLTLKLRIINQHIEDYREIHCQIGSCLQSLGLFIPRGQCVSGHVVQANFRPLVFDTSPKWPFKKLYRDLQNRLSVWGEGDQNHDKTTPFPSLCLAPFSRAPHFSWERTFDYRPLVCNAAHSRPELVSPRQREGDLGENTSESSNFLSSFTGVLIGVEFSSWKVW